MPLRPRAADPWHFPRQELAQNTFALLEGKLARALTLFAPRRTGKTEFLLKDLGPLAEAHGHRVVYASFWQAPLAPLAVLLHALETSLRRGSFADRVRTMAIAAVPKLKLSGKVPGVSADAEIDLTGLTGKPPANLLLYLDDLLARLSKASKPTLLLFDEVQELALSPDNAPLVAALRTSLDKHKDGLATVFTGSSREGLQAMFSARQAPFFHFATPIDLPQFDVEFVAHELTVFAEAGQRSLDRATMLKAFETLHHSPYHFRGLLEIMLANPQLATPAAIRLLRDRVAIEMRYPQTWLKLTPLQRTVALSLARETDKPFSKAAREEIADLLGETAPTIAQVQTALRRLASLGLAMRWQERWSIEDTELRAWILARKPDEIA